MKSGSSIQTYIIKRLLQAFLVCLAISMINFFLLFFNTDPALILLPPEAEVEDIALFKKQMGLDRPVAVQYLEFLRKVIFHGDFGISFVSKIPAMELVGRHIWPTVQLGIAALLIVNIIAIPIGILAAIRRYSIWDNFATFFALVGQAMPLYWFGIMLIIIFGVWLQWLPISGSSSWFHLILPALTLSSWIIPINMRLVRSGMLEVLSQDYIRTARAKGLVEGKVLFKHALKNAIIPLVTITGMQLSLLLGGAVVTETVFAWPGMGRLAVDSIKSGDYPVVQAIVIIITFFIVIANLLADILAGLIDSRIQLD